MTEYRVKIDDIHFKTTVCYEANEEHNEDIAVQYVLDNCMREIKEAIRRSIYVDDIRESEE